MNCEVCCGQVQLDMAVGCAGGDHLWVFTNCKTTHLRLGQSVWLLRRVWRLLPCTWLWTPGQKASQ